MLPFVTEESFVLPFVWTARAVAAAGGETAVVGGAEMAVVDGAETAVVDGVAAPTGATIPITTAVTTRTWVARIVSAAFETTPLNRGGPPDDSRPLSNVCGRFRPVPP